MREARPPLSTLSWALATWSRHQPSWPAPTLADLKTLLPGHTAYAVSRSLHDWQRWVAGDRQVGDGPAARAAIRVQGRIWRELLTGEKAARDISSLSDYLAAGRRGAVEMIRRFWWVAAAAVILTAGVIYAGSYLHGVPDLVRVAGSVAWLAGAAGLFAKGSPAVLGPGVTQAEGWLWQTTLDGSVALAATRLPPGARKSAAGGTSVGNWRPIRTAPPSRSAVISSSARPDSPDHRSCDRRIF